MIGGRLIVGEFVVLMLEWVMENGMWVRDVFVNFDLDSECDCVDSFIWESGMNADSAQTSSSGSLTFSSSLLVLLNTVDFATDQLGR